MDNLRKISLRLLLFGFLLLLAACVGSSQVASRNVVAGPQGPAGPQGERGPQGPAGKDGSPGKDYVAPGKELRMKITKVEIPENQMPVITLTITDENGQSIAADALEGWGFTIAQVQEDATTHLTRYQSLLVHDVEGKPYSLNGETMQPAMAKASQAFADSSGAWIDQGDGVYTYTFGNRLSASADPNLVTVVGVYAWMNNRQAVANDVYSYVQGGTRPIAERQIVTNSACDLCHDPLEAHGGTRSKVALCVTCHTDQTTDPETGNTLELKVMVHRLHFGQQLPSVQSGKPYYIVGYKQNVSDFSKDSWPQDLRYCITCHTGGAQSDHYKTSPNAAACTSCHDSTNLATGENHPGGKQTDTQCAACHPADGDEFDSSITGAHTIPNQSKAVEGIKLQILKVEGMEPGGSPLVTFKVTNKADKPLDPTKLVSLSITMAGPTSDYQNRWTEAIISANDDTLPPLKPSDDGIYQYQFKAAVPDDATGTYAVAMEGYVMETVSAGLDPVRITAYNPVTYVALNGEQPQPSRQVVDQTKCNVCHMSLELHGTIRKNLEYCVMCHNPNATDEARRPAEAMPPTSINFPILIHKIHRGEEANQPLQVYGFGNRLNDFSAIVFPRDLANCQSCHLPNTYGLPLSKDVHPTTITQAGEVVSTILPVRAVCTSCHDDAETGAHVDLQTSAKGVESCVVCHGAGREFDAIKAHK